MRAQALGAGLVAPSPSTAAPFILHRPATLAEAVEVVRTRPDTVIVAGCTDVVAQLREGRAPEHLMSVRRLSELQQVHHDGGVLRLGAGLTHYRGSIDPLLRSTLPTLASAWSAIATVRIRYSGTLGGNLLARRHRYELPLMLGALGAELEFAGGELRPVGWLWDEPDPWRTTGLLTAARIRTEGLISFIYERSMRPLTTVAVAVRQANDGLNVDVVVGSEYREPVHLVAHGLDSVADPELPLRLAAALPESIGDVAGSADYRRHVVAVLIRRALAQGALHD